MKIQHILICFLLLTLSLSVGCGDQRAHFGGTVTYTDGSPVKWGAVNFDNGKFTFIGLINEKGEYAPNMVEKGAGIPEGTYKVWLTGTELVEDTIKPDGTLIPGKPIPMVADQYCNINTSGLTFEAKIGGEKEFNIVVEKP